MEEVHIKGSKMVDGEVTVYFDQDWEYYAHSIASIGTHEDSDSNMTTMWSWINHMRHKRWWNSDLEEDFKSEVGKYL